MNDEQHTIAERAPLPILFNRGLYAGREGKHGQWYYREVCERCGFTAQYHYAVRVPCERFRPRIEVKGDR